MTDKYKKVINVKVEDILTYDVRLLTSFELIKQERTICSFLQILLEHKFDIDNEILLDIRSYLQWVYQASDELAKRIEQPPIIKNYGHVGQITRSSYNFCSNGAQCKDFYCENEPTCKLHHYVHSILCSDIRSTIFFIDNVLSGQLDIDVNEIIKTIKTFCFITCHMFKEIHYIDVVTKSNCDKYHRNNLHSDKKYE